MKTWTQWIEVNEPNDCLTLPIGKYEYEQILLDGIKEGMQRAANKILDDLCANNDGLHEAKQDILTASEQLTVKDL